MSVGKITLSSIAKLDGWLWDQTCVGFGVRKQTNGLAHHFLGRDSQIDSDVYQKECPNDGTAHTDLLEGAWRT